MGRLSVLAATIFLGLIIGSLNAGVVQKGGCRRSYCAYIRDPNTIPFHQPYSQYWCKKVGWELLLSNEFVTIYVLVANPLGYYIIVDVSNRISNVSH